MTDAKSLRWGILGTGMIARKFAGQLSECHRGELAGIGSRSVESASGFAAEFGGSPHGSYDALLGDASIDAVYVSLPNSLHHQWTIRALAAGKHVLCEKPLASNAAEAAEMFAVAERSGRLLVEAFMYRTQPAVQRAIGLVREGAIGELRLIRTNFTFCREASPADARYQPAMGGGALMDVGCYCINLSRAIADSEPTAVAGDVHLHEFGVDDYAVGTLNFGGEVLAAFTCGMTVHSDWRSVIGGSEGSLTIENPWLGGQRIALTRGGKTEVIEAPASMGLYALEADRFAATACDGEPPVIAREDSMGNMRVLDELRRQVGLPV
ncbi:MAG: Gfo/Idh/MocA family oxidoreductase [Pirellulales bacterium]